MKKLLLLLALCAAPAFPISVTGMAQSSLFHSSINVEITASAPAWCQIKYGTSPGVYTYTSGVAGSQNAVSTGLDTCALSLGGLTPNKTYYILPTVWPYADGNSTTNLCQTGGCGATEQSFTTSADPAVHPEPPTAPTTWTPVEPDTSGYTIITLKANGSGTCVANGSSGPGTNWSSAVNDGDDLQTIFNKIWYRTAIRIPQGLDCYIVGSGYFNAGVQLPKFSPAGGSTDWVVVETAPGSPADFPTFGSRIGPAYANHLGIIRAYTPTMPSTSIWYGRNVVGQLFDCDSCGASHIWFRNLEFQGRNDSALYPSGVMDPPMFGFPIRMIPHCAIYSVDCNPDDATTSPDYIVQDRIYIPLQPWPYRQLGCFTPGGNHWLVIGTYCVTDAWQPAIFPQRDETASGAVITVPYAYVRRQTNTDPRIGMPQTAGYTDVVTTTLTIPSPGGHLIFNTATSLSFVAGDMIQMNALPATGNELPEYVSKYALGTVASYNSSTKAMDILVSDSNWAGYSFTKWDLNRPNKITFSGANLGTYTGKVVAWLDSSGLNLQYETAAGVTASCLYATGCNVSSTATVGDYWFSVPATGFWYFTGSFAGGSYSHASSYMTFHWTNPSMWTPWSPLGVYINSGRYGIYRNNYMQAQGQTIYADTVGKLTDMVMDKNYLYLPRTLMENHPSWNGTFQMARNVFEMKELVRGSIVGNIMDGSIAQQNSGAPLYIAGSWGGSWSAGTVDWDIRSNVFKHQASGLQCNGGGAANPPDSSQARRLRMVNNMFLDLNRDLYSNNFSQQYGPSLITGALSVSPGCADMNISQNTIGQARGYGPSIMVSGGDGAGPSVFGEGLKFTGNFMIGDLGQQFEMIDTVGGGAISQGTNNTGIVFSNYPSNPFVIQQHTGTWAARMDSVYRRIGVGSSTPSWVSANNVIVPGQIGTPGVWADIPQSGTVGSVDYITSHWMDNASHIIQGSTQAARLASAGWSSSLNLASGALTSYRIAPSTTQAGDSGANVEQVLVDAGIVTNIKALPGTTYLGFSYTAPDTRACNVTVSADGVTWAGPFSDGGGARPRNLVAAGLTASTAYQYRLLCYFDQAATYEFTSDQITSGTISTLASTSGTVYTGFTLPAGASQVLVTLTPLSGSATVNTCTTSPCSITVLNGTYNRTVQPQTGGAVNVGEALTSQISVLNGAITSSLFDSASGLFDSAAGNFDSH